MGLLVEHQYGSVYVSLKKILLAKNKMQKFGACVVMQLQKQKRRAAIKRRCVDKRQQSVALRERIINFRKDDFFKNTFLILGISVTR